MDLLTHEGIIHLSDYLIVFFAFLVTLFIQMSNAQKKAGTAFRLSIFFKENVIRWIASINAALFLLYVLPEFYFWFMEDYLEKNEVGSTTWNSGLSAAVGLSPLYFLKQFIKATRSKFDEAK